MAVKRVCLFSGNLQPRASRVQSPESWNTPLVVRVARLAAGGRLRN